MTNKSWLLNPAAIAAAKICILQIEEELDIKLRLSHPQFLQMIKDYCELTESLALTEAYQALKVFADESLEDTTKALPKKIIKIKPSMAIESDHHSPDHSKKQDEMVQYKGREFHRYDEDGQEFKGLYRGQARYA
ncbi:MAG: hypothetical protein HRU20_00550 [Pseudomonadales bacterium]|nr:hypothetical protein [Pseudomonadales bacterium]